MSIVAQETKGGRDRREIRDHKEKKDLRALKVTFYISILRLLIEDDPESLDFLKLHFFYWQYFEMDDMIIHT